MTRVGYRLAALAVALCALLLPAAAQASPQAVIRDCKVDGDLDHKYSNEDLRKAEDNLPSDVDEYSDCREIIAGAVTSGSDRGGGRDDSGGPGGGAAAAGGAAATQREKQARAGDKAKLDKLTGDRTHKPRVRVGGQPVQPGDNGSHTVDARESGPWQHFSVPQLA